MTEIVNGIVIGEIETREYYRFYSRKDGHLIWDAGHFGSDGQAVSSFHEEFGTDPVLKARLLRDGIEIRIWD